MNPETSGQLRHFFTLMGTAMASLGWVEMDAVESLVGTAMAIAVPFIGLVMAVVPFYLSYRSKKVASAEAKAIAVAVVEETLSKVTAAPIVAKIEAEAK
jgi:hypothetical protein